MSVLHHAVLNSRHGKELVPFFASLNVDVNGEMEKGETPLHGALFAENLDVARTLLRLGAKLNKSKNNILIFCVMANKLKSAQFVHRRSNSLVKNYVDSKGQTALHVASACADEKMCTWLVRVGVGAESPESTVLHRVGYNTNHGSKLNPFFINSRDEKNISFFPNFQGIQLPFPHSVEFKILRRKMTSSFMSVQETSRFFEKTTTGLTPLMLAARDSDLKSCLALLEKSGGRADATTEHGVSLLHIAATNKHDGMEIIRYFKFEAGLDLKKKDADGEEPIHYAVRLAGFELAKELLMLRNNVSNLLHYFVTKNNLKFSQIVHQHDGKLVKEFDSKGRKALHIAAELAGPEIVKWLVCEAGVKVRALSKDKSTALHFAAKNRRNSYAREMVAFFLSKNLKKHAKNAFGETPMHAALSVENVYVARDLLKAGVRLQKCDRNILMYCVKINKIKSANFIFNMNSHLFKEVDSAGCNLLHVAAEFSNKEMCEWIVRKDEINPKNLCASELKSSIFHHVAKNKAHGVELVSYFAGLKIVLNKRDRSGESPLHYALRSENLKVADEMICNGADLNVKLDGLNLLQFCILKNLLYSAIFVHSKDPSQMQVLTKEGENALHLAAANADLNICQWLCNVHHYVLSLSEVMQNSVLHFVAYNEKHGLSLVNFFVFKGVDVNGRNKNMETPLHAALCEENIKVAEGLVKFGADLTVKINNDNLLHFCIRRKKLASAKFVVGQRPELVNEKCSGGETALQLAKEHDNLELCMLLTGI
ncbi:Hypothetical predicted protein [Cloeon dipterum]|uniref:Uncharacterized protein n=1 Tax=Cloeon dipterum TaxID=197152 RepID=A0A8S1DXA1_9INSE|nr:Hypothetical predicted protein [Cloeon dipterum]